MAVTLATDIEKLFQIRKKLERSRMSSPLFDTQRWVRNLENGLEAVYKMYYDDGIYKDYNVLDVEEIEC